MVAVDSVDACVFDDYRVSVVAHLAAQCRGHLQLAAGGDAEVHLVEDGARDPPLVGNPRYNDETHPGQIRNRSQDVRHRGYAFDGFDARHLILLAVIAQFSVRQVYILDRPGPLSNLKSRYEGGLIFK